MSESEIWGPKGSTNLGSLLRVHGEDGDYVTAAPMHGGFRLSIPRDKFDALFEPFDGARLARMEKSFERSHVDLDYFDGAPPIPCWSNGSLWNGWAVPSFEREAFEAALEDGRISSGEHQIMTYDERVGSFVEVMPQGGENIPDDFDLDGAIRLALVEGGATEVPLSGPLPDAAPEDGYGPDVPLASVTISPRREIETPEGKVTVYAVGDGWCWETADEPSAAPSP